MITALMSEAESKFLTSLAAQAPDTGAIVELGVFQGASLAALCAGAGDKRVIGVDSWMMQDRGPNNAKLARANLRALGYKPRIVTGQSHVIPDGVERVAMLYVDTDHYRVVLERELTAWLPLVGPGGIVALHDYGHPNYQQMVPTIDAWFQPPAWVLIARVGVLIAFRRAE
jgi:predicted O-methyltransferase YrrM